jgi:hypothetical protein
MQIQFGNILFPFKRRGVGPPLNPPLQTCFWNFRIWVFLTTSTPTPD